MSKGPRPGRSRSPRPAPSCARRARGASARHARRAHLDRHGGAAGVRLRRRGRVRLPRAPDAVRGRSRSAISCSTSASASSGSARACAAIRRPTASCLMLGDMIQVLDVPIKVDLAAKKASGWAFREDQQARHRPRRAHGALRRQPGNARPGRDPRNARRLVRRQRRARALARDRDQGQPLFLARHAHQRGQAPRRTGAASATCAPSTSRRPRLSRSRACPRSSSPIACGAPPRSTSSSAPA